ncbi:MAG: DUF2075 domain-containing protein [Micrococcus sp.]|nr:DUF2075 domain-containing protein [Micrococcus sp.]
MKENQSAYRLERLAFKGALPVNLDADALRQLSNWPAVYVIDNQRQVYVGETTNVAARRRQHWDDPKKSALTTMRVVLHEKFNKSAALDLESFLIQRIGGDSGRQSLNGNLGLRQHDYYRREEYRELFEEIFERLLAEKVFSQSREQIINSTLFKLSPFKSLTADQEASLAEIVRGILAAEDPAAVGPFVVQGGPGTGKTVLGVFLMKLLADLARLLEDPDEADLSTDEAFHSIFTPDNHERLRRHLVGNDLKIGIVVPQQSLRRSLQKVFRTTPGLHPNMVMDPWDVGKKKHEEMYDVLIVDEAHRLNLRASQSSGMQNALFPQINADLFGRDDLAYTQLDWIIDRSHHQILLLDPLQTVRPADLDRRTVDGLLDRARTEHRYHALTSQLRVEASDDYVDFFGALLRGHGPAAPGLGEYELRMFTDFGAMHQKILKRNEQHGLARLAAGYAWPWQSKPTKSNPDPVDWDIELDGVRLPWNRTDKEWVTSPGAEHEVGSIHTLQGYDLNYTGVVIGPDLVWNEAEQRVQFVRPDYFDKRGKRDNVQLGRTYTDEDLREYVINIYNVLLTRGVRGTYLYVVDPGLRAQFARWFPTVETEGKTVGAPFGVVPGQRPDDTPMQLGPADARFGSSSVDYEQSDAERTLRRSVLPQDARRSHEGPRRH